jgi:hypothetical protein
MATLDWHCTAAGSVTLVQLLVTADRHERVRIENRLDGPVLPPRTGGVPEPGWDEDGVERRVEPDSRVVLGYACPADPAEPPAEIAGSEPVEGTRELTARDIVRTLGDGAPPRDVTAAEPAGEGRQRDGDPGTDTDAAAGEGRAAQPAAGVSAIEERIETAERLAAASTVAEAERAVEAAGGLAAVRSLRARLAADRDALDALARRCERLRERADDADVPVETLARVT